MIAGHDPATTREVYATASINDALTDFDGELGRVRLDRLERGPAPDDAAAMTAAVDYAAARLERALAFLAGGRR